MTIVQFPVVSSEFKFREELEKAIEPIIMVDQLQEICYDGKTNEYKEYSLVSRTQKQGTDFGNIDDMITVYHQWKKDRSDKSFRIFLEYEEYEYYEGHIYPNGIHKEAGLLLKIKK